MTKELENTIYLYEKYTRKLILTKEYRANSSEKEMQELIDLLLAEIIRIEDIEEVDDLEDFCECVGKNYMECKHMSSKCKECIKQYFERKVEEC